MDLPVYEQYVYGLTAAYRQYGSSVDVVRSTIEPFAALRGLGATALVERIRPAIAERLAKLSHSLAAQIIAQPRVRFLDFGKISLAIPMINQQGIEWYSDSPLENFDFTIEKRLGLFDDARVIYDLGGHHGVWAAYYSKSMQAGGTVYSFEPSLLNVEVSSLLLLINNISNVVTCAAAVGLTTDLTGSSSAKEGMLVDFVDDDIRVVDFRAVSWRKADFLKMDIEGFEYELLTSFPWIFDLATNLHIELHIPHLERRGLDYKDVTALIPFDNFDVSRSANGLLEPIAPGQDLSGYCSLMMKRR